MCLVRLALRCMRVQLKLMQMGAPLLASGRQLLGMVAGGYAQEQVLQRFTVNDSKKLLRMAALAMEHALDGQAGV